MIDASTILRIIAAFTVVFLALYAFAAISRHRMSTTQVHSSNRLLSVIETTPLPGSGSLHVIKVGERYHVIALNSGAVSHLTEIEAPIVERRVAARSGRGRLWPL